MTHTARPRGFTLVEFLMATSIAAFATLGIASMFPTALRSVIAGGEITKATTLVQAMTDIIRSESFENIEARYNHFDTQTLDVSCPLDGGGAGPLPEDYAKKKWTCDLRMTGAHDTGQGLPGGYGQVSVDCVDASGAPVACPSTLRRVIVTVFWGESGSQSVSLVSNVARIR